MSASEGQGALYVQYGCGTCAPRTWTNFDASARLRLERSVILGLFVRAAAGRLFPANVRFGDIVRGLPVADGSAAAVFCSHVLEHLARDDLPIALRNTLRILVPGGTFRLVVPDLQWRAARYLAAAAKEEAAAADEFMGVCNFRVRRRPKTLLAAGRAAFGRSEHLWMYDFAALKSQLEQAGFVGIRRCEYGDAADPSFAMVEDKSRFVDGGQEELALEALRPS